MESDNVHEVEISSEELAGPSTVAKTHSARKGISRRQGNSSIPVKKAKKVNKASTSKTERKKSFL